ncbi:MAG: hypothetical protein GY771_07385 [bacterium]|nr:hypothetical protein [bacterium]
MKTPIWLLIVPLLFASGCCCKDGDWEYSYKTGNLKDEEPESVTGGGGLYVNSVEDGIALFKDALVAGDPDPIVGMTADEIMIGEPYSEGWVVTKSEFADALNDPEAPITRALFSKERVSSFVNEHKMGTLVIEGTKSNTEEPEPDGGKSVSTKAHDWYLEFHPTGNDFGNKWELTICAVWLLDSDG